MSGLMGTMATGMAFGAGSEIAHQGVRAMMGGGGGHGGGGGGGQEGDHQGQPAQQQYAQQPAEYGQQAMEQPVPQENPCISFNQSLLTCLQQNRGEISMCQNYMDMLTQCERDVNLRNYQ